MELLRLGPERLDIGGNEIAVDQEARPAGADAPEFLVNNDIKKIIEPETAVFLIDGAAQHPGRAGLEPQLPRHDAVLLPLRMKGHNFLLDEATHRLAPHFVLSRKK